MSGSAPIPRHKPEIAVATALAAEKQKLEDLKAKLAEFQ